MGSFAHSSVVLCLLSKYFLIPDHVYFVNIKINLVRLGISLIYIYSISQYSYGLGLGPSRT